MKRKKIKSRKEKLPVHTRPNWDEYFLGLLPAIASRATCERGRSGTVIVDPASQTILTTGYVGSVPGDDHCDDAGHFMVTISWPDGTSTHHCQRTLHAEENAILQAAMDGTPLRGATLYCQMTPCLYCARRIARVGIKRVVALRRYHNEKMALDIFKKCGVKFEAMKDEIEEYKNQ